MESDFIITSSRKLKKKKKNPGPVKHSPVGTTAIGAHACVLIQKREARTPRQAPTCERITSPAAMAKMWSTFLAAQTRSFSPLSRTFWGWLKFGERGRGGWGGVGGCVLTNKSAKGGHNCMSLHVVMGELCFSPYWWALKHTDVSGAGMHRHRRPMDMR